MAGPRELAQDHVAPGDFALVHYSLRECLLRRCHLRGHLNDVKTRSLAGGGGEILYKALMWEGVLLFEDMKEGQHH